MKPGEWNNEKKAKQIAESAGSADAKALSYALLHVADVLRYGIAVLRSNKPSE